MFDDWRRVSTAIAIPHVGALACASLSTATPENKQWFQNLKKPSCMPPTWCMAVGWTAGYSFAGYASYLVWREGGGCNQTTRASLAAYGMHLVFRWAWAPLMFSGRRLDNSVFMSLLFSGAAVITSVLFHQVDRESFYWFVPYTLWCCFSTYLSIKTLQANP